MLTCQKDLFSIPDDIHYLNAAYMSPLSRRVEEAGVEGIRRKRVPSVLTAPDFFEESDAVRLSFATLIGSDEPERVALIPSASYGISTVARNTKLQRGDNLVMLHEQFPSNVYVWRRLVESTGAELRTIPPPSDGDRRAERWNEHLLEAIDARTALVALPPIHWADGTRFDLESIGTRAREVGAAFVIDGTQSVGAMPFDVGVVQPDALVCAAYKWLLGPYSTGVAYFGPRYDDGIPIEENWITRRDSEHCAALVNYKDTYQPGAIRYDVGERSNFALMPMLLAGLTHLHEWGVENIQTYCEQLTHDVLAEAQGLGFQIEDPAWRSAHLFGVRVPDGLPMAHLREALAERNIAVSVRGNAIRISPHVYNDADDMDALREAFHACLRVSG